MTKTNRQFGFDEATQKHWSKDPLKTEEASADQVAAANEGVDLALAAAFAAAAQRPEEHHAGKRRLSSSRLTLETHHSMVQNCALKIHSIDTSNGNLKQCLSERCVLPPVPVETTSAICIGAAICMNLHRWIFGGRAFLDAMRMLDSACGLFFFLVAADAASSNGLFLQYLACLLILQTQHLAFTVVFHYQKCGLHQMGRSAVAVISYFGVVKQLDACSSLFKQRRNVKKFESGIKQACRNITWEPFEVPPDTEAEAARVATLKDLLFAKWPTPGEEENLEQKTRVEQALDEYLAFFNCGGLKHGCRARGCHKNAKEVLDDGQRICLNLFNIMGRPNFQSSKWLALTGGIAYWATWELVTGMGRRVMGTIAADKEERDADAELAGPAAVVLNAVDAMKQLQGVRMKMTRRFFNDAWTCFNLAMSLALAILLESVVAVYFLVSDLTRNNSQNRQHANRRATRGARRAKAKAAPPRSTSGKAQVIKAVRKFMQRVWHLIAGGEENVILSVALGFAPPEAEDQETKRRLRGGIINMSANVYFRIQVHHNSYPDKFSEFEAENDTEKLKQLVDAFEKTESCCKSKTVCIPLYSYVCKSSTPENKHFVFKAAATAFCEGGACCVRLRFQSL